MNTQPQSQPKPQAPAPSSSTHEPARFISLMPRIQGFNGSGKDSITFMPSEDDVEVELTGEQVAILLADPCAKALVESGELVDVDNVFGLAKRRRARRPGPQSKLPPATSAPQS